MTPVPSAFWPLPKPDQDVLYAISLVNFTILCQNAFSLRRVRCRQNTDVYTFGGVNLIYELKFDDGAIWIVRLRRLDNQHLTSGIDIVLESEVATIGFLRRNTTIPVPEVFYHDARFGSDNPLGLPYMLMEAMPGKRLYGGGFSDFIPDQYKSKVYRQIADFELQLFSHPFPQIGMLLADQAAESGIRIAQIHDQHHRIPPFGPFSNSYDFYLFGWQSLNEYYNSRPSPPQPSDPSRIVPDAKMPVRVCWGSFASVITLLALVAFWPR